MTDPKHPQPGDEPADDADTRRRQLDERARAAFIERAEHESIRRLGRGLTAEELERALRRYQARHRE